MKDLLIILDMDLEIGVVLKIIWTIIIVISQKNN